nr:hypothetical protein [Desulfovibrio sp.]
KEELRAEIASWMLCSELGLKQGELEDNHAAYIESWSRILKERPVEILKACTDADKIRQFILNGCRI